MQTVPSLIGAGTAIAAAASGLVFGQPVEPNPPASSLTSTSTSTSAPTYSSTSKSTLTSTIIRHRHSPRPKRQISYDRDLPIGARLSCPPSSQARPTSQSPSLFSENIIDQDYATSSADLQRSRPPLSRYHRSFSTKGLRRKLSLGRNQGSRDQASVSASTAPNVRVSTPSTPSPNGSWIKRLSLRPLSLHESSISSFGFETSSATHSHSSSLPILPGPQTSGRCLSRNKLVKRPLPIEQRDHSATSFHSRSKSYLSSLRRPATSHRRSATEGHIRTDADLGANRSSFSPITSFDQQTRRGPVNDTITVVQHQRGEKSSGWTSFFHSKRLPIGGGGMASRFGESRPLSRSFSGRRISLVSNEGRRRVHLIKPRMVQSTTCQPAVMCFSSGQELESHAEVRLKLQDELFSSSSQSARPLSMSLPSTSNEMLAEPDGLWLAKRRQSVGAVAVVGAGTGPVAEQETCSYSYTQCMRHVSAPISGVHIQVDQDCIMPAESTIHHRLVIPAKQSFRGAATFETVSKAGLSSHKRSWSSPLLIYPRTSNFHIDSPHRSSFGIAAGDARSTASPANSIDTSSPVTPLIPIPIVRRHQASGSSWGSSAMSQLGTSTRQNRSSIISVSGSESRGFMFGDEEEGEEEEEDTDFKSDTMYDSLRTAASSRLRTVETPLDSVYDESPPNTACTGRTKRLSIQDMLGSMWDDDRIVEEDENDVTAIRGSDGSEIGFAIHPTLAVARLSAHSSHDTALVAAADFGRLCLEDDFDEDWGDEDTHFSPLSPPSKNSSLKLRGIHPNIRPALADFVERNETGSHGRPSDTPLSSLFDWIDPPTMDSDADGPFTRPKTASGKHEVDARGGRTSSRRGPVPAHVRSQSVPITHDGTSMAKPSSAKYGTWALGTKPVSEDWDEDFEFSCVSNEGNDDAGKSSSFQVPESIRASQPSVKAHSGQIRELSLLVNDLKRLCRHGRDMDMLEGPHIALWKEAEGVIALASPDEEDEEDAFEEETNKTSTPEPRMTRSNSPLLGRIDTAAFDNMEPAMSKIAVVRGRSSPKRRSVFSPEDDIFGGGNWPLTDGSSPPCGRSPSPRTRDILINNPNEIAKANRSVMEAMCRSMPHQTPETPYDKKVHFDTNSLKVLVRRAGELRDSLSDLVRHAERITHTPSRTPRRERHTGSSPAFTKVFDDPNQSPQQV